MNAEPIHALLLKPTRDEILRAFREDVAPSIPRPFSGRHSPLLGATAFHCKIARRFGGVALKFPAGACARFQPDGPLLLKEQEWAIPGP
jgi:hypothetical protein